MFDQDSERGVAVSREDLLAPAGVFPRFKRAAVLGAGTMGAQIAAHLANAGLEVELLDIAGEQSRDDVAERGLARALKASPSPFFSPMFARRIRTGNFEDHLERIRDVEWVIEAVVERAEVKQALLDRVESAAGNDTIVSSNTSGIPISRLIEGRSEDFRSRFLGTHFFNPPRYLKLLEIIPSESTDPDVVARIAQFGRVHLGKGVVLAKDVPYFIGNRIGVFALMLAIRKFVAGEYSIEEIDALSGPLVGRPKSATFRTADVVGLDVMLQVADNLFDAVPDDESREVFRAPELLRRLVEEGRLGQKSGAGFYRKQGREIKSIDPETLEYRSAGGLNRLSAAMAHVGAPLKDRLQMLFHDDGPGGAFFRDTTLPLLAYAARRIPEITEYPADVDRAIRWGFGWELGPFQLWDALGFDSVADAMDENQIAVPDWISQMRAEGRSGFYQVDEGLSQSYVPAHHDYMPDPLASDELPLSIITAGGDRELFVSESAALHRLDDGVALLEFRSKANTLGVAVMQAIGEAVERVEHDRSIRGLVIANEGANFSAGANLAEMAGSVHNGSVGEIGTVLARFQDTLQRIRYARKPVVVAVHQRVLGGACELLMASPRPIAAAESYIGLVELAVGLIPAGTGCTRLAALAASRTANGHPSEIMTWIRKYFETVAMAGVSTSAREAQEMGFLPESAVIVMNADRRVHAARQEVLRCSSQGYEPPSGKSSIRVLGAPGRAALEVFVQQYLEGRFITEYDAFLANRLAFVLTGGDLTAAQDVDEEYMLELEREVFLDLLSQEKTQQRIEHMLKTKKPLRN